MDSIQMMEDMRFETNGLQSLIGVMSKAVAVNSVPVKLPKVVFRVAFDVEEKFMANCMFRLVSPSRKTIYSNDAQPVKLNVLPDSTNVVGFGWTQASFPEFGEYQLRFGVDGKADKTVGKFVVQEFKGELPKVS